MANLNAFCFVTRIFLMWTLSSNVLIILIVWIGALSEEINLSGKSHSSHPVAGEGFLSCAKPPCAPWLPWWAPPASPVEEQCSQRGESSLLACSGGLSSSMSPRGTQPWLCKWSCCHSRALACVQLEMQVIAVCGETLTTSAHRPDESFLFMTSDPRCSSIYRGTVDLYMGTEGCVL